MNSTRPYQSLHQLPHYFFQAMGYAATVIVLAVLVLVWLVTSPILRLLVLIGDRCRSHASGRMLRSPPGTKNLANNITVKP